MTNSTEKNQASGQTPSVARPRRLRAACDEILADFRRGAPGTRSLKQIHTWRASALLAGKLRAAETIGTWAYEQFEVAANAPDVAMIQLLIDQGMLPLAVTPITQLRPLDAAASAGFEEGVRLLIDAGAEIDAANYQGWRALHAALFNSRTPVAALLLDRGASVRPTPGSYLSIMTRVATMPGLGAALLGRLIWRHPNAAPVLEQIAEARQMAAVYSNISVSVELDRLEQEENIRALDETTGT